MAASAYEKNCSQSLNVAFPSSCVSLGRRHVRRSPETCHNTTLNNSQLSFAAKIIWNNTCVVCKWSYLCARGIHEPNESTISNYRRRSNVVCSHIAQQQKMCWMFNSTWATCWMFKSTFSACQSHDTTNLQHVARRVTARSSGVLSRRVRIIW